MGEDIIFKRRNRLKKHFVNVSNVLLYCYACVSDAAKITFQIIDGFDWESKETGDSKGFVFPAVETIAKIRYTSIRTIQRHILELIKAKLLTRLRQRNKPSILYIEEVSDKEIENYFQYFESKDKKVDLIQTEQATKSRNDKNVVSHKAPETTKMSFAYKEENEKEENEINVNENFQFPEEKKSQKMQGISAILSSMQRPNASRQILKVTTKNKSKPEDLAKRDYLAQEIADTLHDRASLGCYRVIAEKIPQQVIYETLASVKETWKEGKIKKRRGALFVEMIKAYGEKHHLELGFKNKIPGRTEMNGQKYLQKFNRIEEGSAQLFLAPAVRQAKKTKH